MLLGVQDTNDTLVEIKRNNKGKTEMGKQHRSKKQKEISIQRHLTPSPKDDKAQILNEVVLRILLARFESQDHKRIAPVQISEMSRSIQEERETESNISIDLHTIHSKMALDEELTSSEASDSLKLNASRAVESPNRRDEVLTAGEHVMQPLNFVTREKLSVILDSLREEKDNCLQNEEKSGAEKCTDLKENHNESEKSLNNNAMFTMKYFRVKKHNNSFVCFQPQAPMVSIGHIAWKDLNQQFFRLSTFCKYPMNAAQPAIKLAEAGFAYMGSGASSDDTVICYFCVTVHKDWQATDVIQEVHARLSPDCPMVTGRNCNNVKMPCPKDGHSLFARLDAETGAKYPEHAGSGEQLETEAALAANHPESQASARVPKPAQAARRSTASQGQAENVTSVAAAANREGIFTVTAHEATDTEASFEVITSSNVVTSSAPLENTVVRDSVSTTPAARAAPQRAAGTDSTTAQANSSAAPARGEDRGSSSNPGTSTSQSPAPASSGRPSTQAPASTTGQTSAGTTTAGQGGQTTTTSGQSNQTSATASGSGSESSEPTSGSTGQGTQRQSPSYQQLGIITERPKRFEYAMKVARLRSYNDWPRGHHLTPEDLSDAGFYYAGYGDCARCFYCGGGLRNWEVNDNVWVEHARWFPKCAFMRQTKGQAFIDAVKTLSDDNRDEISYEDVMREMGGTAAGEHIVARRDPLDWDAAVLAVTEMGFRKEDAQAAAAFLKDEGIALSADKLFERLHESEKPRSQMEVDPCQSVSNEDSIRKDQETISTLKEQNSQLRQQTICKICMDNEVAVVFLPCGHLVSCSECASALENCPVCRQGVRGIVRAFMG